MSITTTNPNDGIVIYGESAENYTKYRDQFNALVESGVFDIESGRVELNIHNGQVQNVHVRKMTYKRKAG